MGNKKQQTIEATLGMFAFSSCLFLSRLSRFLRSIQASIRHYLSDLGFRSKCSSELAIPTLPFPLWNLVTAYHIPLPGTFPTWPSCSIYGSDSSSSIMQFSFYLDLTLTSFR